MPALIDAVLSDWGENRESVLCSTLVEIVLTYTQPNAVAAPQTTQAQRDLYAEFLRFFADQEELDGVDPDDTIVYRLAAEDWETKFT